ncbi:hypothetical protein [Hymenobacter glacieicola]|nr:hypothetical protein [Hymenobacter glacieicola]
MAARTDDPEAARKQYADDFVDMLYDFVTGAEVVGTVTTTGSAATQTGLLQNGKLK